MHNIVGIVRAHINKYNDLIHFHFTFHQICNFYKMQ